MIKYKLVCKKCKILFDSWFASSIEFEKLKKKIFCLVIVVIQIELKKQEFPFVFQIKWKHMFSIKNRKNIKIIKVRKIRKVLKNVSFSELVPCQVLLSDDFRMLTAGQHRSGI